MADVEHVDDLPFNREENAINVGFASVEKLPNLERKYSAFGRNHATLRECGQGRNGILQGEKPSDPCVSRMLFC